MHDYLLMFSALCLLSLNSERKYGTVVHTVYYTARKIQDRPECRSWCSSTSSVHRQAGSGYAVAGLVPSYILLHFYWYTGLCILTHTVLGDPADSMATVAVASWRSTLADRYHLMLPLEAPSTLGKRNPSQEWARMDGKREVIAP